MKNKINKTMKIEIEKRKMYSLKNKNTIRIINNKLKNEINKTGIWRTKEQNKDVKYRKYCRENNIINTEGGWKNKVYSVAKSEWQRKWDEDFEKMNKKYAERKKKPVKIITKEAIILYDKETGDCDAYEAEVEKIDKDITVKIPYGNKRKLKVKVHHETIDDEEIIGIALENRARIFVIDEILN